MQAIQYARLSFSTDSPTNPGLVVVTNIGEICIAPTVSHYDVMTPEEFASLDELAVSIIVNETLAYENLQIRD